MNHTLMTIFGCLFIFLMTTLGALIVFFFKKTISPKVSSIFLGFASGVMVASSVWSLIIPSIDSATYMDKWSFLPAVIGIILGSLLIILIEKYSRRSSVDKSIQEAWRLFIAVTIHNIPEGLAVGFAFGMAFSEGDNTMYALAMGLAIGIGVQNLPEGAAVALPINSATGSRTKGFLFGVLSGVVEPIFAVIGFFMAAYLIVLQPWLLAFAAGAMLYVVASDLMREAHISTNATLPSVSFIVGFIIMMLLDVLLG